VNNFNSAKNINQETASRQLAKMTTCFNASDPWGTKDQYAERLTEITYRFLSQREGIERDYTFQVYKKEVAPETIQP